MWLRGAIEGRDRLLGVVEGCACRVRLKPVNSGCGSMTLFSALAHHQLIAGRCVRLSLFKCVSGASFRQDRIIEDACPNTGAYKWQIPMYYSGEGYVIEIKSGR